MYKDKKNYVENRQVKYAFEKTYKKTHNLLVVFSDFKSNEKKSAYDYEEILREFDCNKLFISDDFGLKDSYYLCENRDFSIEHSIITLINEIIEEYEIKTVVMAGSGKGGYAALYYGIKYGFDHIIAASPQYLIGNYLMEETSANDVVTFMSGNDTSDDIQFLNTIMTNVIKSTKHKPNIFLHLGENETNYEKHVSPLIKDFERVGISYILDLGDYERHSDVVKFFPRIFKAKIREYLGYPELEISVKKIDNGNTYRFTALTEKSNVVAWYLYYNNYRIEMNKYLPSKHYDLLPKEKGQYKLKVFVRNKKGLIVTATSPEINV